MKTFLITGSYGFIASNLLEFYAEKQNLKIISIGTNTVTSTINLIYISMMKILFHWKTLSICRNDIPDAYTPGKGSVSDAKNIEDAKQA